MAEERVQGAAEILWNPPEPIMKNAGIQHVIYGRLLRSSIFLCSMAIETTFTQRYQREGERQMNLEVRTCDEEETLSDHTEAKDVHLVHCLLVWHAQNLRFYVQQEKKK